MTDAIPQTMPVWPRPSGRFGPPALYPWNHERMRHSIHRKQNLVGHGFTMGPPTHLSNKAAKDFLVGQR